MKRYTHPISAVALLLLVLSMLVSACTRSEGGEGESTTSGDVEKVITSGQHGTELFTSTAEMTGTVTDADVTTTMSEVSVTTTTTAPVVTTSAPITTTTAPVTTTEMPVTTTTAPITTTTAPITTTTVPITTDAPVTTTKPVTTITTAPPVTTEAPHTHSFSPWSVTKAATCMLSGTQKRTCACGVSETKTVDASGHSWGAWVETKAATCTATGSRIRTCTVCSDKQTESVPKTAHTGDWVTAKEATCTEDGSQTRTCQSCSASETQVIESAGEHSYGDWVTTKAATCTENGTQERTCTACDAFETQEIAATGHVYGSWSTKVFATCTESGARTHTCMNCGEAEDVTIDANGHNWSGWIVTTPSTLETEGEESRTCCACDAVETQTLAVLEEEHEHSYGEWILCDDYINEIRYCACGETETQKHYANPETDEQLVADRVIYYINQYREEEGSTTVEKLDRLTLVAQMRSTQLVGLTASSPYEEWHSTEDLRECGTYYEYGKKMANRVYDPETGEVIYDGTYFYLPPIGEAVGHNGWSDSTTIDNIAFQIASQIHGSSGHWSYVGSSDYSYIAVGVTEAYGRSYFAIFVSDTNQYE